ncbi:SCO family protein [Maritimibacter sp. HL-12]|uniref:SCO family protein n=1 Tax=Maritimibacter sp. HL-12 TaxID=1162418 RepID=UPI000A0F33F8|nr:SCO family protein [Maritimibacter sp. HL-12]SMH47329.1 protein SCO1/2 [Maritimibacter sp. HL-12]
MLTRRSLIAGAAALALAPIPLLAQHQDLGVTESDSEAPLARRWMMEDTLGNVVTNLDYSGKFVLIYFGYTGCPDVCPTTLATLAEAIEMLGEDVEHLAPLFVTVDPDRDTAQLLRDYTGFMHPAIIGLRGPLAYTDHMVKTFNARYEKYVPDPATPERYSIDHTASVAVVGPDGQLVKRFPHGTPPDQIADEMRALIASLTQ